MGRILIAVFGLFLLAASQRREAYYRRKAKTVTVPTTRIYGRVPGKKYRKRPLNVGFFVQVGGLEKLAVPAGAVHTTVLENAGVVPGIGTPTVKVDSVSGGYDVQVKFPDSGKSVTPAEVKTAIEGIDPRLKGRVSNVTVTRGR